MIINNLEFTTIRYHPQDPDNLVHYVNVTRVSDNHWLSPQIWFDHLPTPEEVEAAAVGWSEQWTAKHGRDPNLEPPATFCTGCGTKLVSDTDTNYQYDNALFIGFHGGYGMATDNLDATMCTNSLARYLCDDNGDWLRDPDGQPVENPDWKPEYREPRILPGPPDHEAVICHGCFHKLCDSVGWIAELLKPYHSHAHRVTDIPQLLAEGHQGWDLDKYYQQVHVEDNDD